MRRSLDGMLRDTVTPTIIHVGKKMNVVPGSGEAEIDVRTLPGTDQEALLRRCRRSSAMAQVESVIPCRRSSCPADAPIVELMQEALRRADPRRPPRR